MKRIFKKATIYLYLLVNILSPFLLIIDFVNLLPFIAVLWVLNISLYIKNIREKSGNT